MSFTKNVCQSASWVRNFIFFYKIVQDNNRKDHNFNFEYRPKLIDLLK